MDLAHTGHHPYLLRPPSDAEAPVVVSPNRHGSATADSACCDESFPDFVRWLAAQAGLEIAGSDAGLTLKLPEEERQHFAGRESLEIDSFGKEIVDVSANGQPIHEFESRPLEWLLSRACHGRAAAQAQPRRQPSLHSIAGRLFPAYQIEGGQAHIAGCQLFERVFVRLSYLNQKPPHTTVRHWFVAADASDVASDLIPQLGLDDIQPMPVSSTRIAGKELSRLVNAARNMVAESCRRRQSSVIAGEPLLVTLIWTKYATGHLQFSIGDQSVTLPFEGWPETLQAPPYFCTLSGVQTFQLSAVDDGRILAADQIGICSHSGRRVPRSELVRCHVTNHDVCVEYTEICPVLDRPVLRDQFVLCSACRQNVSRSAFRRARCSACRNLELIDRNDESLTALLEANPGLLRWRRWRAAKTQKCYLACGANLLRKLLVVCDRRSLKVRHIATGIRGLSSWSPLDRDDWPVELNGVADHL